MNKIIEKAFKILTVADEYNAEILLYEIRMGTNKSRMHDDGSLTRYCKNCIDNALQEKKKSYFLKRQSFMGKIYEYQACGYYLEPQYVFGEDGKAKSVVLKKVQSKEDKEKVIKYLKQKLRKEYPKNMKFDSECYNVSCSEYDGFENCDDCGVIFEQGLLLTNQELDHWQGFETSQYVTMIIDPYHAYQLRKIIDHYHPSEYADRVLAIADKVIQASELITQQNRRK